MRRVISLMTTALALTSLAYGCVVPTPEIDGSTGAAAIGLLVGGALVLRARRKKKAKQD